MLVVYCFGTVAKMAIYSRTLAHKNLLSYIFVTNEN